MMKTVKTLYLSFVLLLFLLIISACQAQQVDHYYFSLSGESESWKLSGYEVEISPTNFKAGNGTFTMKNVNKYNSDYFYFNTHVVLNGVDTSIHSGSKAGIITDISEETSGTIEGSAFLNKNNEPVSIHDVSEMYIVVEWSHNKTNEMMKEKIDLYFKEPSYDE